MPIEGTTLGAAVDASGDFLILNVSPDLYWLRVIMLGFATAAVEDVVVQSGLTTRISVAPSTEAIEIDGELLVSGGAALIGR